ncbi:MAG TPA: HEAT repeat domain-containing protein, partial [Gemmataceae bacterium]|nr:HEAT repeat domain-containing protein [Gemmataceae bacterium]
MHRIRFLPLALCLLAGLGGRGAAAEPDPADHDVQALREAKLPTEGKSLVEFFKKRTLAKADRDRIKDLIRDLGNDDFDKRQAASAQLTAIGAPAAPLLREAAKSADPEVVRRAKECLKQIESGVSSSFVAAAARVLAARKPDGAVEALLGYAPFAEDDTVAEAVRNGVAALAVRDGKPEPAVVQALADKAPARRAAAAFALSRVESQRPAVRKLLKDADATVRLRAGLGLAAAKEKDAVPVLIDLLAELPPEQAWPVEDMLYRLAGDNPPADAAPQGDDGRRKQRDAWAAWWKKHGDDIDLAKLNEQPKPRGWTMVVLLDKGVILELDAKNKPRWQIEGLQFPLDAQYLPGDRVLVAEQGGNRVTERNLKGEIVWQRQVVEPLVAQRLRNGNTFIATRQQLIEVDPRGKVVYSHIRPGGELIMRAQKLRNGDIALVVSGNNIEFVRMNAKGNEVVRFPVDVSTSGGRIEVLPNGHVLAPLKDQNKVVEYDGSGKVVWQADFPEPVAAVRLRNGHT